MAKRKNADPLIVPISKDDDLKSIYTKMRKIYMAEDRESAERSMAEYLKQPMISINDLIADLDEINREEARKRKAKAKAEAEPKRKSKAKPKAKAESNGKAKPKAKTKPSVKTNKA